jgi:lipoprotein signal peptidase
MYKKITILTIIFIIADQLIKLLVSNTILLGNQNEIIPNFFYLTNVHNDGAAWSMFSGNVFVLAIIGVLALIFVYFAFIKDNQLTKVEIVVYSLLIGGIVGNLIDRIFLGYVVDYLGFIIINYYFPIFNLADIGIVLSIGFILFITIKEEILCKKSELKKM